MALLMRREVALLKPEPEPEPAVVICEQLSSMDISGFALGPARCHGRERTKAGVAIIALYAATLAMSGPW